MSTAKWANIGDDPGSLHALLERIPEHCAIPTIDYLWLFPSRQIAIGESVVIVMGVFADDTARRRVSTAHFTVSRDRKGAATVNVRFDEHGSAPVAAVPRIVQGVLRRLGEDAEASPREEQIGGDQARWDALIEELGGDPVAELREMHKEMEEMEGMQEIDRMQEIETGDAVTDGAPEAETTGAG